jgi:hypothetical protein
MFVFANQIVREHQVAVTGNSVNVEVIDGENPSRCATIIGVVFRTGIDFFILPDGKMVCGTDCAIK